MIFRTYILMGIIISVFNNLHYFTYLQGTPGSDGNDGINGTDGIPGLLGLTGDRVSFYFL